MIDAGDALEILVALLEEGLALAAALGILDRQSQHRTHRQQDEEPLGHLEHAELLSHGLADPAPIHHVHR